MKIYLAVLRHELLLQRRKLWPLMLMLFTALLVGPVGVKLSAAWVGSVDEAAKSSSEGVDLPIQMDPVLAAMVTEADHLLVVEGPVTEDETLEGTEAWGRAELNGSEVTLYIPTRFPKAGALRKRVLLMLRRVSTEQRMAEYARVGVVPNDVSWTIEVEEHGSVTDQTTDRRALPAMLCFLLYVSATFIALDTVTAEKEKGTAETLLSTRLSRRTLMAAKATMVWLVTLGIGLFWLTSMVAFAPDLLSGAPALLFGLFFLSAQMSAVAMIVGAASPNFKSASVLTIPVMMLAVGPSAVATFPDVMLSPTLLVIPVANMSVGLREWLGGELSLGAGAVLGAASLLQTGLFFGIAAWWMDRMDPLDKGMDAESRRAVGNYVPDGLGVFAVAMIFFWFFGMLAQARSMVWGMAFTQIGLLATIAVLGTIFVGAPLWKTLSLRVPRARDLAIGIFVGCMLPGFGGLVATLCNPIIPMREEMTEAMSESLLQGSLPVILLTFAVLPGVCEELLFRGAIFGMLRSRLTPVVAIAVSSVFFGFLHVDLARIVTTGCLGVVLGILAYRTRSVIPAMVAHTLNNGILLTVGYFSQSEPAREPPTWMLGVHVAMTLALFGAMAFTTARAASPAPADETA